MGYSEVRVPTPSKYNKINHFQKLLLNILNWGYSEAMVQDRVNKTILIKQNHFQTNIIISSSTEVTQCNRK